MRLFVYVEGLCEELFVNRQLRPHLSHFGWRSVRAIGAATSLDLQGQRGGLTNWAAVEADLKELFSSQNAADVRFTTLWDYYRTPHTFPGFSAAANAQPGPNRATIVEAALKQHFAEPRFVPYIQMHEFEALVLAALDSLKPLYPMHAPALEILKAQCEHVGDCESINDGVDTHPAQRIDNAIPGFVERKAQDGPIALRDTGLDRIRQSCPRFDQWLHKLERLAERQENETD